MARKGWRIPTEHVDEILYKTSSDNYYLESCGCIALLGCIVFAASQFMCSYFNDYSDPSI